MPKSFKYALMMIVVLAMVPPALIARLRAVPSEKPPVHIVWDMDFQPKWQAQQENPLFADLRAMRPLVPGTVARGKLWPDEHLHLGVVNGQWAKGFPASVTVDMKLLARGQDRFNIYCTPCHGFAGYGDGMVHQRAQELVSSGINGTQWVAPKSLHEDAIRQQPPGQIFNTISNGVRNMSGYASQIPIEDRWAIAAYVKALQRSQNASPNDVGMRAAKAGGSEGAAP